MEKHFPPGDSADTSFVLSSDCSCTNTTSCVFGGLEPKSTSHLTEMSRGYGSEEELMVFLAENILNACLQVCQLLLSAHQRFV